MATGKTELSSNSGDIEPKDYNAIVGAADLAMLRMASCSFYVKPDYYAIDEDDDGNIRSTIDSATDKYNYNRDAGIAFSIVEWRVLIKQSRRILVKIEASYLTAYRGLQNFDPEHVRIFYEHLAPSQSYPYFRQFVAQKSADAALNLPVLPMMKLRAPVKSKAE